MDWFTGEMLSALFMIIVIDLVLAGDNAIVIGMAARNLPKEQQKKAVIWGTVGAVVIRAAATLAVVWLLAIPGLLLVGGLFLIWIAIKLLTEEKNHDNVTAGTTLAAAIRTIVIADAVMGIDNILAVAGAAHGSFALVVVGLAISVPVMVWGSTLVLKLMDRYPATMYIGAAVLAFTAAKMVVDEKFVKAFIGEGFLKWTIVAVIVVIVMAVGAAIKKDRAKKAATAISGGHEPFKAS
jgi:YjbE family integral membrane protein